FRHISSSNSRTHTTINIIQHQPPHIRFPYTTLFRSSSRRRTSGTTSTSIPATQKCAIGRLQKAIFQRGSAFHSMSNRSKRHKRTDRKSTRLNSSHVIISYAVLCLKKNRDK